MQYCGIRVNSITYFIIVLAIGLLVDFLMHILLRYYESKGKTRHEKVKETLETMGSSILLGGFTTWLGVIPMALSTTKIFMTVSAFAGNSFPLLLCQHLSDTFSLSVPLPHRSLLAFWRWLH